MNSLSIVNVIKTGLHIYFRNFKQYFKLALIGHLWILVPVYGWAKFSAMIGVISHLAYGEIAQQTSTIKDAQRDIKPKMWLFLIAGIDIGMSIVKQLIFFLPLLILIAIAIPSIAPRESSTGLLLFIVTLLALLTYLVTKVVARLFLVESSLAVEETISNIEDAFNKSKELTSGTREKIQVIILLVALMINLPIILIINLGSEILLSNNQILMNMGIFKYLIWHLIAGIVSVPLWQAIKVVIYHESKKYQDLISIKAG